MLIHTVIPRYIDRVNVWREWRRPRSELAWAIVAFVIFYAIFVGVTLNSETSTTSGGDQAVVIIVGLFYVLAAGGLAYRVFIHSHVTADATGLTIANPFRSDQHLTWDAIASMKADRLLWIFDTAGQRHIAWVIQKNGWSRMRHERTEADVAIDELGQLAGRALGTGPKSFATRATPAS
jgi:hypothetical protein